MDTCEAADLHACADHLPAACCPTCHLAPRAAPSCLRRYGRNWLKVRALGLTQYHSVLLVDSDVAVAGDLSPLFGLPTEFAAVWDQSRWLNRWVHDMLLQWEEGAEAAMLVQGCLGSSRLASMRKA